MDRDGRRGDRRCGEDGHDADLMRADGGVRPCEGVRCRRIFPDLHAVREEIDTRRVACGAAGHRRDRHARRVDERLVRGRSGDIDHVDGTAAGRCEAVEGEIEHDIRTGDVRLMNFRRDDVLAGEQAGGWQGLRQVGLWFGCRAAGCRSVTDRARRHVVPEDFGTIQINNHAVVPQNLEQEAGEGVRVRDGECSPKIVGDVFVCRVAAEADGRDDRVVAVGVAERSNPGGPQQIDEARISPFRPLVRAIIEILPGFALGEDGRGVCGWIGRDDEVCGGEIRPDGDGVVEERIGKRVGIGDGIDGGHGVVSSGETRDVVGAIALAEGVAAAAGGDTDAGERLAIGVQHAAADAEGRRAGDVDDDGIARHAALHVAHGHLHVILARCGKAVRGGRGVIHAVIAISEVPRVGERVAIGVCRGRGEGNHLRRGGGRGARAGHRDGRLVGREGAEVDREVEGFRIGVPLSHRRDVNVVPDVAESPPDGERRIIFAAAGTGGHVDQL